MKTSPKLYNGIFLTILTISFVIFLYNSLTSYLGAGRDDTFITLWVGKTLAEGNGIVNYNFEPLEMSSSLLHVFIVAGMNLVIPDYIYMANKAMGLFIGGLVLIVVYIKMHLFIREQSLRLIAFTIISLGLANYPAWLYWNLGGVETPYQTLILFLYGIYLIEYWEHPSRILPLIVLQSLYILVRPEGFILTLFTGFVVGVCILFQKPINRKHIVLLIGLPIVVFSLLLAIRQVLFGMSFPNSVYAKVGTDMTSRTVSLFNGAKYLLNFYTSSPYTVVQFIVLIIVVIYYIWKLFTVDSWKFSDEKQSIFPNIFWIGLILMNHAFILATGGDWMEFFRFIVPIIPFLVIITTIVPFIWISLFRPPRWTYAVVAILFMILIGTNLKVNDAANCSLQKQLDGSRLPSLILKQLNDYIILLNCTHNRDEEAILPFIKNELPKLYNSLGQDVTIVTYQMGYFPYYIKQIYPHLRIRFIDTGGLGDEQISRLPFRKGSMGLLAGAAIDRIIAGQAGRLSEYVLSKHPNMVYMLSATLEQRRALEQEGWELVWDKPNGVVFVRKG